MRDFLIDTQTIRYWYDSDCPQHVAVLGNINLIKTRAESLAHKPKLLISVVTLGEIEFGHRVSNAKDSHSQDEYFKFVHKEIPAFLELLPDAVAAYGELRSRLFNKYAPKEKRKPGMRPEQLFNPATALELQIQENDLWICAQAVAHRMVLVTNDGMPAICNVAANMNPPLMIQNWTEPNSAHIPK